MPLIPRANPLIIKPSEMDSCVIFLHGLTTSGLHFQSVATHLASQLPHTQFILPHAPVRYNTWAGQAVSSWYDLLGNDFLVKEDASGIQSAVKYVHQLIDEQIAQGISSQRIFLGGFSQGCAISLLAGTSYDKPLGGIIGLSGYLPLANQWQDNGFYTPILWLHGSQDSLITLAQIEQGKMLLAQHRDFTFQTYPIEHQVTLLEVDVMGKWIQKNLNKKYKNNLHQNGESPACA
ncbi:alpha/beta hydrolase [Avibacterium sp. 21-594]|uniref:alpha/beta hydrolase n=1 Tax=Avibacterium sp. 21-594 TaxID=2911535 RepID=UPI0022450C42|nr:phospholipase [Avibacterium sp. 21-594]MCW9716257.1 alpha/beta hydrolase [Avibacterium sp. 21-594]